jgi:hypothetical protein
MESSGGTVSDESVSTIAERYPGLPSTAGKLDACRKQSLAERLEALDEQPENPTGNWLLTTPLRMNFSEDPKRKYPQIIPNVPSQPSYASSVSTFCADCDNDHSSQPAFLFDASSSYTYASSCPSGPHQ